MSQTHDHTETQTPLCTLRLSHHSGTLSISRTLSHAIKHMRIKLLRNNTYSYTNTYAVTQKHATTCSELTATETTAALLTYFPAAPLSLPFLTFLSIFVFVSRLVFLSTHTLTPPFTPQLAPPITPPLTPPLTTYTLHLNLRLQARLAGGTATVTSTLLAFPNRRSCRWRQPLKCQSTILRSRRQHLLSGPLRRDPPRRDTVLWCNCSFTPFSCCHLQRYSLFFPFSLTADWLGPSILLTDFNELCSPNVPASCFLQPLNRGVLSAQSSRIPVVRSCHRLASFIK